MNPCKCPPHKRLRPEVCNPKDIQQARLEAACAARRRLEGLCANKPQKASAPCPNPRPSCPPSSKPCVIEDCQVPPEPADNSLDMPCTPLAKPDCGPQPDGKKMCVGVEGIQAWQKDFMEQFLNNHRNWRRGEQPGTPSVSKPKTISRSPLELPDNVQEFLDNAKLGPEPNSDRIALCTFGKIMDEVEHKAVVDIRCALEEKGAAIYGIPNDTKINYIHLLTKEVWCERSKVSLELKLLRKILQQATEEADEAQRCSDAVYNGLVQGAQDQIDCWVKEYKRIMDCLRPLKDRRRLLHHKALTVCRSVKDATEVLHLPLQVGISAFSAKRSGVSPVGNMMSNLGSDILRAAYGLFGVEFAKCTNFAAKLGVELDHELSAASWASVALCEYLQLRGPHFPRAPDNMEEMNCEGPLPPLSPVPYQQWATMRDTYMLYREASYFRTVLKSHDFVDKEAACAFPAFPEKDRKCIFHGYVSASYLDDNVGLWKGRWAIRNAILNRSASNPIG
ncbi:unnamed protein product [Notodromas monacha]|uniref:Uncharacterized protein n=1 Tax=Notodromas monacha TaxID=399045 RepID=A0A7R9BQC4_9CRUS|nr:unnamed protein product [Notodromas monacha]CAG0919725.1 unnamed protein product [Notodromas monacha]